MITLLRIFIVLWLGAIAIYVTFVIIGVFLVSDSAWQAVRTILYIYSPFDFWNLFWEIICLVPAVIAFHALQDRLRRQPSKRKE